MMKCVAIDDEPLALQLVQGFAQKTGTLDVVATFTDAVRAKEYLQQNEIDLLFLDIQMPDINGLDFFSSL
jgi:YesN/AraC family two-component response regulator